jgi:hypothetical protein
VKQTHRDDVVQALQNLLFLVLGNRCRRNDVLEAHDVIQYSRATSCAVCKMGACGLVEGLP